MLRIWSRFETALHARLVDTLDDDTGDVPGWVLITLMTAGLSTVSNMAFSN
ncbi:hypothetical protein R2Q81_06805 [Microbacterium aquimaris]|uniref:hypothetical protein n=1 Tax=Microbacterium aquimaris TaxID=459816 RepID=UPI002AD2702B|nr:hypothetical protein [Microbacterium aquimaris]MDZ8275661.1 hypothetical protein [Microbacterium aquimaris]